MPLLCLLLAALSGLLVPAFAAAPPRYAIAVEPVHEVCLAGSADATWAAARLAGEGRAASLVDGRARLEVCGSAARFGGRAFREGIVGLAVAEGDTPGRFLVAAVNTAPFYAWVERARNRSPYRRGAVEESFGEDGAARLALGENGPSIVAARAAAPLPPTAPEVYEGWIFQPGRTAFAARLEGAAASVPFAEGDKFTLPPRGADPLADLLRDADFRPDAWMLRAAGRHAKSNTVRR